MTSRNALESGAFQSGAFLLEVFHRVVRFHTRPAFSSSMAKPSSARRDKSPPVWVRRLAMSSGISTVRFTLRPLQPLEFEPAALNVRKIVLRLLHEPALLGAAKNLG